MLKLILSVCYDKGTMLLNGNIIANLIHTCLYFCLCNGGVVNHLAGSYARDMNKTISLDGIFLFLFCFVLRKQWT